ncbi:MAG TPA: ABC transporter ATP-binding protein [Candidatus Moranbacteria bacterium]|nr:ABC transporter ATP-binding protein [Candidatus Moranbacteria bacterium]
MKKPIAIKVNNLSKTFVIPHEKITSLRSAAITVFKKKGYEEFEALDDVSFEIKKGEFFGIIGRNGSGKSTLLKILAGIYTPDQGSVRVDGLISPFLELGIGFNPELSGRDNIYLNATVLGMSEKEVDEKFDEIVHFSELGRFIDQKLKNYSSGMRVRLAFSVSIHANREILLMDEVLAVGDNNFQSKCLEEFRKYKSMGRTVVLVTHDINVVRRYCDRAMLLRQGKIVSIGDVNKVTDQYVFDNMSDEEKRLLEEEKYRVKKEAEEKARREREDKIKLAKAKKEQLALEKKKIEEEKKAKAEKERNRFVEITKVEFLGKEGRDKKVFETGEKVSIKIKYKVIKPYKELNFGVGLHAVSGGQIFGYNTQMDDIEVQDNKTELTLAFDSLPLLEGEYFVNIACWGAVEQSHYDFKPNYATLKFFAKGRKGKYRGFVDIPHKWLDS